MTEKYILQFSYTVYSSRVIAGPFASQIRPEQRMLLEADMTGWGAAMLAAVDGGCKYNVRLVITRSWWAKCSR